MKTKCTAAIVVALMMALSVQAGTISINLAEGEAAAPRANQTVLPGETAGYGPYAAKNWNNVQVDATGAGLVDDTGTALVGAAIDFVISTGWGDGSVDTASPDGRIARGYFDDGETSPGVGADIQITGVPYELYDVVIYMTSDFGTSFGEYTVNGIKEAAIPVADGGVDGWTDWVLDEYVLLVGNVTGATLDIHGPVRDGATRGTIAGLQIVEVPEPATLMLLGMGGLALLRKRRS